VLCYARNCGQKLFKQQPSSAWRRLLEPESGPMLHTGSWKASLSIPAPQLGTGYGAGRRVSYVSAHTTLIRCVGNSPIGSPPLGGGGGGVTKSLLNVILGRAASLAPEPPRATRIQPESYGQSKTCIFSKNSQEDSGPCSEQAQPEILAEKVFFGPNPYGLWLTASGTQRLRG